MGEFNSVRLSLRKFAGINLEKGRSIPDNWVVVKEETVSGPKGTFLIRQAVYPDTFTGFAKGMGEQTTGGYLGAGNRNLGIEVEVRELSTGDFGSDRVWENVSYSRQQDFFNEALTVISRTVNPSSSISAPQERQGSLAQVGIQRNPSEWMVGDVVNVSRPSLDGGGLTTGYVVRVYPATVDVMWSPDAIHPKGWKTTEKKRDLIYAGHNENWRKVANKWLDKQFYAEAELEPAPAWTKMISVSPEESEDLTTSRSPLPISADVWRESDEVRENLEWLLNPYKRL
jgi:hypothetical protein